MGIVVAKTHCIAFASEDTVKAATEERVPNAAWQGRIVAVGLRIHVQCPMAANSTCAWRSEPVW
jgi:hypothetical protein